LIEHGGHVAAHARTHQAMPRIAAADAVASAPRGEGSG